jgi:hypothetical protein
MFDEMEANKRRTLLSEWRRVAESPRVDTSRREQAIEAEAAAQAQAAADERAELVRAISERSRELAESPRHRISAIDRQEARERRAEREQREAAEVAAWISRRNREDVQRSQPVVTARAESGGDDGWDAWRRFVDARVAKYVDRRIDELVERKIEDRMLQIYRENHEFAVSVRKSIEAIARALEGHDALIREAPT